MVVPVLLGSQDLTINLSASNPNGFNITGFRVWNYNEAPYSFTNTGIRTVEILTSPTGVAGSYTSRGTYTFDRATGLPTYEGQEFTLGTTWTNVKFVQLRVTQNWGDLHYAGLGKIEFVGSTV